MPCPSTNAHRHVALLGVLAAACAITVPKAHASGPALQSRENIVLPAGMDNALNEAALSRALGQHGLELREQRLDRQTSIRDALRQEGIETNETALRLLHLLNPEVESAPGEQGEGLVRLPHRTGVPGSGQDATRLVLEDPRRDEALKQTFGELSLLQLDHKGLGEVEQESEESLLARSTMEFLHENSTYLSTGDIELIRGLASSARRGNEAAVDGMKLMLRSNPRQVNVLVTARALRNGREVCGLAIRYSHVSIPEQPRQFDRLSSPTQQTFSIAGSYNIWAERAGTAVSGKRQFEVGLGASGERTPELEITQDIPGSECRS